MSCVSLGFNVGMIKPSAQSKVHQAFGYEQGLLLTIVLTLLVHFRLNILDGILNDEITVQVKFAEHSCNI